MCRIALSHGCFRDFLFDPCSVYAMYVGVCHATFVLSSLRAAYDACYLCVEANVSVDAYSAAVVSIRRCILHVLLHRRSPHDRAYPLHQLHRQLSRLAHIMSNLMRLMCVQVVSSLCLASCHDLHGKLVFNTRLSGIVLFFSV